jgi:hypothetical protein
MPSARRELPLRIVVVGPLRGVAYAVQRGRAELLPPSRATADEVAFDLTVRVSRQADGSPNFLGAYAQGTPADRFVYVSSGKHAGDAESCWDRRAKVRFAGITWELIERVLATPGAVLEARIPGRARDGGPVAASVKLLDGGWTVADTASAATAPAPWE